MKRPFPLQVFFLLYVLFTFINTSFAQLTIDAGTRWVSDTNTYVSLDALGMRYYADADMLSNAFLFSGNNDSHIESSIIPNFRKLVVNKESHQLLLNANINVLQRIRFQSGLFNLNNYIVALSPGALIENENEASRFTDTNYGFISITVNATNPTALNPGNLGAVLSLPSYSGDITIVRSHHQQIINRTAYNTVSRLYDILLNKNGSLDATLRLYYFDAEKNGLNESKFVIWEPVEGSWNNIGVSSRNTILNYVEQTSVNRIDEFTIAPYDVVLAVSGLKLSGIWKNNASQLTWITSTEINNDHFEIERKYPQDNGFTKIASITTKNTNGNSQTATSYAYADAIVNANASTILYRLKQVNKGGSNVYSNTVTINPAAIKQFIVNVYPTISTKGKIFIQAGNVDVEKIGLQIFDMSGKCLLSQSLPYQSQWLLLPPISSGIYKMLIQSGDYKYMCSFIQ